IYYYLIENREKMDLQLFIEECRRAGIKVTPQRIGIFKILSDKSFHPTINEIYERAIADYPSLSLNTVYKTVQLFCELGFLSQFKSGEGIVRYEAKVQPHHHILCLKCNKIEDVFDESLDTIHLSKEKAGNFNILKHDVIFYGYCENCNKERRISK
ncbi:MAG: transcriptional repressor, partial [Candidatus Schekmanbacteria bacterium]